MAIPLQYLPLSTILFLAVGLVYILYLAVKNRGDVISGPASTVHDYIPVVYVIAVAMIMHFIFLFNQSAVVFLEFNQARQAYREKKVDEKPSLPALKYGLDNVNIRVANRLAGNFSEQIIPFLLSLHLYATFVSVRGAVLFGWAWLFFRSYYGWAFKRGVPVLFLSTIPAYCCVWGMIGGTIYEVSRK
eukprot:CAMPEP_0172297344 /NCGR_PEP_ID=MMETSP1058-20130122/406_1 /TAXON_ID=83371 /ORGANISM="Detonula confervacea, Strain CCMP 353" /LENGTH=187 /DNA_ID=CAMNT_0013006487 /DNA_START=55 /DNA_END=618 /DNA_ORIENTATION=+